MNIAPTLSNAARVAIAFGVHRMRGPRAMAATVLSRFAYELARDGFNAPSTQALIRRIAQRWTLGDYFSTVHKAYTDDLAESKASEIHAGRECNP